MSRGFAQLAVQPAAQISVQSAAQLAVQSPATRCVRCSKKENKKNWSGFAHWREAAQGIRLCARGVAPPPFCERLIFFASPNCRLFAGKCKGWRSLLSGAASQRRHRQGFWRDRRVYRQDVGGGGLLGRSPLALSCFLNTGRRGALLSHVFFSRFFSRSLLESASRRGALHSSLCSQLRRSLCSKLRSPQCRVLRSGVFAVQKKKEKKKKKKKRKKRRKKNVCRTFPQNLNTFCHFLTISVKFRQNFVKFPPKNRKIHRKMRMK